MKNGNKTWTNFWSNIIGVCVGAALSIISTIVWDQYKSKLADIKTKQVLLTAIKSDAESDLKEIVLNKEILKRDFSKLKREGSLILDPPNQLKTDFFDLVKLSPINCFSDRSQLLRNLRDLALSANHYNETIKSREDFRVHNIYNFQERSKIYDQELLNQTDLLLNQLNNILKEINLS